MRKINPEILSDKPTHLYHGILIKVFTLGMPPSFDLQGRQAHSAEIMEGEGKGKWTTVYADECTPV